MMFEAMLENGRQPKLQLNRAKTILLNFQQRLADKERGMQLSFLKLLCHSKEFRSLIGVDSSDRCHSNRYLHAVQEALQLVRPLSYLHNTPKTQASNMVPGLRSILR
jgi:hypothetical protein